MQPRAIGTGLIAANDSQSFALRQSRVIQIGPILDAQYRGLSLHPLYGAPAVRGQDGFHGDPRIIGLVDHAVVSLDGRPVSLGYPTKSAPWHGAQQSCTFDQPLTESLTSELGSTELLIGPLTAVQALNR